MTSLHFLDILYNRGQRTERPRRQKPKDDKMDSKTKTTKINEMKATMHEYDRLGDVVLRDQMKRAIAEAKATW